MTAILDSNIRYLQLAFNDDLADVRRVLPQIAPNPRILIEAGTPFIKREGVRGMHTGHPPQVAGIDRGRPESDRWRPVGGGDGARRWRQRRHRDGEFSGRDA